MELNLSYYSVACLLDCVNNAIKTVQTGESVLNLPCESLKQEEEILVEYADILNQYLDEAEWLEF